MYEWTREEIEKILKQLDERQVPLKKYTFVRDGTQLQLLGRGGFAVVYEAQERRDSLKRFAVKVIGFSERSVEAELFLSATRAQEKLARGDSNVVYVHDTAELYVWVNQDCTVTRVERDEPEEDLEQCLKLQFIVLEKLEPVLTRSLHGTSVLRPAALEECDEKEIIKVAYDIGNALAGAHRKHILHRDVKLENIFYSSEKQNYKLGDFGIASVTNNGLASTVTYTMGYGAPEVIGKIGKQYDQTADIYSLGILLYVLMNRQCFPDSQNYHANLKMQYGKGYTLPRPKTGSEELFTIVEKMCMYDPDDRYQTLEDMLNDLEKLIYNDNISYRRKHRRQGLVISILILCAGIFGVVLCCEPLIEITFSKAMYGLLILGVIKFILCFREKKLLIIYLMMLVASAYLFMETGFSWWKFLLVAVLVLSEGNYAGVVSSALLSVSIAYIMMERDIIQISNPENIAWIPISMISIAAVLLFQTNILMSTGQEEIRMYLMKARFWGLAMLMYGLMIPMEYEMEHGQRELCVKLFSRPVVEAIQTYGLSRMGIVGLLFCVIWITREKLLIKKEKTVGKHLF